MFRPTIASLPGTGWLPPVVAIITVLPLLLRPWLPLRSTVIVRVLPSTLICTFLIAILRIALCAPAQCRLVSARAGVGPATACAANRPGVCLMFSLALDTTLTASIGGRLQADTRCSGPCAGSSCQGFQSTNTVYHQTVLLSSTNFLFTRLNRTAASGNYRCSKHLER